MQKKYTNEMLDILRSIQNIDYITPDEIPNIDLYMDQVTTFMDEHLQSSKRFEDDKILTKTMINNYTKNNLLPPPTKKKYSSDHMLLLIYIYYLKNFLSINDIQSILKPLADRFFHSEKEPALLDIYEEIVSLAKDNIDSQAKDIIRKLKKSSEAFGDVTDPEDKKLLTTFTFICMLSFDVWVKKNIIENIIDDRLGKD
jgi:DNA-binding transcriptional MerR regulator